MSPATHLLMVLLPKPPHAFIKLIHTFKVDSPPFALDVELNLLLLDALYFALCVNNDVPGMNLAFSSFLTIIKEKCKVHLPDTGAALSTTLARIIPSRKGGELGTKS